MRGYVVRHVALAEFQATVRARWVGIFAVAFAGLALLLSYFGMVHTGFSGFVGFVRTSISLLSLSTLLMPLVALTLGAVAFSGDRESLHLLMAQPLTRTEAVIGRYLGLYAALTTAAMAGLGAAGVVIAARAGADGWLRYAGIAGLSVVLLGISLALGTLIGVASPERGRALGGALVVWGLLVLLYDLLAMGISVILSGETIRPVLLSMVLANPVDLVRVAGLLLIGARASLGAAGAVLAGMLEALGGKVLMPLALSMWWTLPLFVACRQAERQDI